MLSDTPAFGFQEICHDCQQLASGVGVRVLVLVGVRVGPPGVSVAVSVGVRLGGSVGTAGGAGGTVSPAPIVPRGAPGPLALPKDKLRDDLAPAASGPDTS